MGTFNRSVVWLPEDALIPARIAGLAGQGAARAGRGAYFGGFKGS